MDNKNGPVHTNGPSKSSQLVRSFLAGSISGTVSCVALQPLELVKTRLQKSGNLGSKLGMFNVIANVVKQEKIRSLWNGLVPSLFRTVPGISLYFTTLHAVRSKFESENPHPLESMAFGATCRGFTGLMVLPFTVMKVRYESGDFNYRGLTHALKTTYAKEGLKGLYSGFTPTLIRDVPYSGLYLMFYTKLKSFTSDFSGQYSFIFNFFSGVVAACLSSSITQPADVIKTHMQLYPNRFGRVKHAIVHIYQESGLIGFQRGIVPRTMRRTFMSATSWSIYDEVMRKYTDKR